MIAFNRYYNQFNFLSITLVLVSLLLLTFKGLNFGIDFKGGTLIELRINEKNIKISDVRSSFSNMNLGDLNVKEFGKKGDYLIKFEKKTFDNQNNINNLLNDPCLYFYQYATLLIDETLVSVFDRYHIYKFYQVLLF